MKLYSVNKMIFCLSCERRIDKYEPVKKRFETQKLFYSVLDQTIAYPPETVWYHTWKGLPE